MKNTNKKNACLLVALILNLVNIGVFLYLNKHHVDLKLGLHSGSSLCSISEKVNCDTAASSSYSELLGVPIALLGAFTAGLSLIYMLIARFSLTEDSEKTARFAFYVVSFMAIVSVAMAGISLFVLKSACPFCIASYVLTLLTWGFLILYSRPNLSYFGGDLAGVFTEDRWVLGTLITVPILSFIVNNMILDSYGFQQIKQLSQDSLANWSRETPQNFNLENGLVYQVGSEDPKVVIVEFADFLCPHCRVAVGGLHNFAKAHSDVRLVFKSFPLDGVCNPVLEQKGDGKRCDYAFATFCAETIGKKGWMAHNYFFDRQDQLFTGDVNHMLEGFAKESGVNLSELKSCMSSEEIRNRIQQMAKEGDTARIGGTPAIFLNGRMVKGGQIPAILENIYRSLK